MANIWQEVYYKTVKKSSNTENKVYSLQIHLHNGFICGIMIIS